MNSPHNHAYGHTYPFLLSFPSLSTPALLLSPSLFYLSFSRSLGVPPDRATFPGCHLSIPIPIPIQEPKKKKSARLVSCSCQPPPFPFHMFFSLYPRCVFHFYLSCCFVFALVRIASHTFFLFLLPAALVDFGCLCYCCVFLPLLSWLSF